MQRGKYRYAEEYFAGGRKIYGAYHFIYGYFARRTGKNACLLQSPGESFSEWRNHHGIFQLHKKDHIAAALRYRAAAQRDMLHL